jgi:PAS domain S-box-containing protein
MVSAQSTPSSSSPEDLQQALRSEQLQLLFETQPFNIAASLAIAAIVAITLLPVADTLSILLWCGIMVISNMLRAAIAIAWRCDLQRFQHTLKWQRYSLISSLIGGTGWGLCNFMLFPAQNPEQQMLLVFITSGISAAAAVSLAVDRRVAWGFLIPCTVPLEIQLYMHSSSIGTSLSAMGLVYLVFMVGVINRLYNYIRNGILLRLADSEREQLQNKYAQALHSSQEKLQALFELSPLGCVLMKTDGTLVEANQALRRMLGYSDEDIERLFNVSGAPVYRDENRQGWAELVKQRGTDSLECELKRKDGSLISVSLHRVVIDTGDGQHYVWSLIEDITERKHSEEQLLALNNRLSLATQAGGIGVWEMDLVHHQLLWDARMREIGGIGPGSGPLPIDLTASLVHPDDWDALSTTFAEALKDPTVDRYVREFRIIVSDDIERALRTAGIFRRDERGRVQRMIGVAWDITEIKRVERMKSEFVSMVSHELRTPLTSIRGSLGLVASGVIGEVPTAVQELIDIAYKNSERLSFLINDILDIEKIESGKMRLDLQRQTLRPVIEQAIAANQGFAQNFAVHLRGSVDRDAMVNVDTQRFMQVMANLISNAVKFSNADDTVEIAVVDAQANVRIEVRDRGPGIPADFRERIFQRFSQADSSDTRARGGSGLGLAISKTFVEKMQGEIGFAAREGGGTVFFVELPRL